MRSSGPNYRYDTRTTRCIKTVDMSGDDNEDYWPKKKTRRYDDDWEGAGPVLETLRPFFEGGQPE